jgi:hypothetical protein
MREKIYKLIHVLLIFLPAAYITGLLYRDFFGLTQPLPATWAPGHLAPGHPASLTQLSNFLGQRLE